MSEFQAMKRKCLQYFIFNRSLTECNHEYKAQFKRNLKIRPNFDVNEAIKKAEDVERLEIYFGFSTHIFAGIGEVFINLKELWIRGGRIRLIARSDFVNLKKLKWLWLSGNPIKFAADDIFYDLNSLEELRMVGCSITKLPEKLFNQLRNLKILYVYKNEITHLPKGLFANNLQLEKVWVNENQLQTIEVDFRNLPTVKEIELSSNVCTNEVYSPEYPEDSTVSSLQELQEKINRNCTKTDS